MPLWRPHAEPLSTPFAQYGAEAQLIATLPLLLILVIAGDAGAQTSPRLPRWDIAASTGVFVSHPGDRPGNESFDEWYQSATLGVTAGRYLTTNLKVEGEIMLSGEGSRYGVRLVEIPGLGFQPISSEQLIRTNGVSGALVYQFFENQWVHPFLMAGATLDFDREGFHTWPQSYYRGDPRLAGSEVILSTEHTEHLDTTRTVRALLGGGAKLYVSPQAFFRADTRIGIGAHSTGHVAFRLGFGLDF